MYRKGAFEMNLEGIIVPIVTIFKNGAQSIDHDGIKNHADYLVSAGVHAIIANGTTGDFFSMNHEEKRKVAETVVKQVQGKVPALVGTTSLTTVECVELSKHAEGLGADGVMVAPPYYMPLTKDAILHHYEMVGKSIAIPILLYNNPLCTGQNLTPGMVAELSTIKNLNYVKESTGSMTVDNIQQMIWKTKHKVKFFCGEEHMAMQALSIGADGLVMGHANGIPEYFVQLFNLMQENKFKEARDMQHKVFPLWNFTNQYHEYIYNSTVKSVMKIRGLGDVTETRSPIIPLNKRQEKELEQVLQESGLLL
jgi:4-hydroxy-tetrahydrodipicolinate synthase